MLPSYLILTLASMLTPLRYFCYNTSMVLVDCVKCPSFHSQCLDCFECTNSILHFHTLRSVHARYKVLRTEGCSFDQKKTTKCFSCHSHINCCYFPVSVQHYHCGLPHVVFTILHSRKINVLLSL